MRALFAENKVRFARAEQLWQKSYRDHRLMTSIHLMYTDSQWRNYVGSALRQTFPRRPTEFQN